MTSEGQRTDSLIVDFSKNERARKALDAPLTKGYNPKVCLQVLATKNLKLRADNEIPK